LDNAYLQQSAITSASAAETAAVRKTTKYSSLSGTRDFFPVALETLGPLSVSAEEFLAQIGRRLTDATTDPREKQLSRSSACLSPSSDSTWQTRSQFPSPH